MSDYEYGIENGLWGTDGIPYGLDDYQNNYTYEKDSKAYNSSEKRAIRNGFKEVADENAYNGRYFVKDGLKWIHKISSLKKCYMYQVMMNYSIWGMMYIHTTMLHKKSLI